MGRIISLGTRYQVEIRVQENGLERYVPQKWVTDPKYAGSGYWESLLEPGKVRLTFGEAQNDCVQDAGLEVI